MKKEALLRNFKFVVLFEANKNFTFLQDEEEVKRWIDDGSIQDGDMVLELSKEFIKIANKISYLELK